MKKLIMGFGTNQTREALEVFLRSAREVWSPDEADVFLLTNSVDGIHDLIEENSVKIFQTTNIFNNKDKLDSRIVNRAIIQTLSIIKNTRLGNGKRFSEAYYSLLETIMHPILARWLAYRRLLMMYRGYDGIIMSDTRDVRFQSDIFSNNDLNGVGLYKDCGGFSPDTLNAQWYVGSYGKKAYRKVSNSEPICAGVIAGRGDSVRDMVDKFASEIAMSPFGKVDQAVLNYNFYNKNFKDDVKLYDNLTNGVATLGAVDECRAKIEFVDGKICLLGGAVIPIVHMYDRGEETNALVNKCYGLSV